MSKASTMTVWRAGATPQDKGLVRFLSQPLILEEAGPPRALLHTLTLGCVFLAGFIVWATVTPMNEIAAAHGQIMPAGSVQVVQHLEGGIVNEVMVSEGQVVERGQPVMRLEGAAAEAELDQLRAREAALAMKAERLRSFVLGNEPDFSIGAQFPELAADERAILSVQAAARESQRDVLLARIKQREAEIQSLTEQRVNLKEQVEIIREQLEMRRALLAKGLVSKVAYLDNEAALSRALGELSANNGAIAGAREALNESRGSLVELDASLGNDALTEMGAVGSELAEVRETLRKLEDRERRLELVAPVQGIVKGLSFRTVGAVVPPGETVMEIVPFDDSLVAEVRIEPRDIGYLQPGQEARVKVSTYDLAKVGSVEGRLEKISASTFQDEEGQPYYKGTIVLANPYVGELPGENMIMPGMVVDADISTGSKTLLRYLLKPVFRSLDRAFSER